MYVSRHDADLAIAVWLLDRPTPDEWRRFTLDIVRVAQWDRARRPLVLFVAEHLAPDRGQSTHLAELIASEAFGARVAVVMVGALSRSLEAALGRASSLALFEDVEDALEWLADPREGGTSSLRELWRAVNLERPPLRATEPG